MQKSSSVSRRTAFRAVAVVYALLTAYFIVVVVRALLGQPATLRGANLGFAMFSAAATCGLWMCSQWGKTLALLMALGTSSLGVIAVLTVLVSHHGALVGWIAVFLVSTALTYVLSRPIFNGLPYDE